MSTVQATPRGKQEQGRVMAGLRPFAESDVVRVADLIWKVLHGHQGPAPSTLRVHLQDLFFQNPWLDEGIVSRVFENSEGKIVGFFGAVPRRMSVQGKTVRLAFGSNFVVDPESRTTMMAIQLVKAFMKGPQDVSITDSANDMSRQLLRSLGFAVVPIYSMQWARPLRPSRYAVNAVVRAKKKSAVRVLGTIARPFCGITDSIVSRLGLSPFVYREPEVADQELDTETLLTCLQTIPSKHWLLPEYDQNSLNWVFEFIAKRKVFGDLRKAAVRNKDGKIVGWYIYSLAPGRVGEVLQIGAESPAVSTVLDHLFYDAWKNGLIGLHGRMEPQFMQELTAKGCFFFRHGSWTMAHSAKPELLTLLHGGTAFFSRLDGEWSFRHGGQVLD